MIERTVTLMDGAMGTMLQSAGLKAGERPEILSITQGVNISQRAFASANSCQTFPIVCLTI